MNFMHFSRHHMQHWRHARVYCNNLFLLFLALFCRYAITARIVLIMAIMREPNAAVPTVTYVRENKYY